MKQTLAVVFTKSLGDSSCEPARGLLSGPIVFSLVAVVSLLPPRKVVGLRVRLEVAKALIKSSVKRECSGRQSLLIVTCHREIE